MDLIEGEEKEKEKENEWYAPYQREAYRVPTLTYLTSQLPT